MAGRSHDCAPGGRLDHAAMEARNQGISEPFLCPGAGHVRLIIRRRREPKRASKPGAAGTSPR